MRQHHSALIARAEYYKIDAGAASDPRRHAAADYVAQATIPEPIIVERIAAAGYWLAGGERWWIARGLSMVYWFAGAAFLFGAARRLTNVAGGLASAAVFLLMPYSIGASLSFQPDALAVLGMCAALFAMTRSGIGATVVCSMLPILVRPMTAFFLAPAMAVVLWPATTGPLGTRIRRVALFIVISGAPALIYVAYRFMTDATMGARAGAMFAPGLLVSPGFWRGWAGLAWMAFGPVLLVAALAGAWLAGGRTRALLMSLWGGYALYGLLFNLHISTHPYYQTIAVPMVALSIAPLVAMVVRTGRPWMTLAAPAAIVVALLMWGARQGVLTPHADPDRIAAYEAVGRITGHSRRVIFLTDNWGVPLRYYADIAGRYWPAGFEIDMYRPMAAGIPDIDAEARLRMLGAQIGGAEFFAVTDVDGWSRQPGLRALLDGVARVRERTDRVIVYELGRRP